LHILADLRGLGLSERTAAGYDKQTIAGDVRALIDEGLLEDAGGTLRPTQLGEEKLKT